MSFLKKHLTSSIIIVSLIFLAGCGLAAIPGVGQYDDLAKHLTESGFKMYGTEWCGYCKQQKELFGSSFQYINYEDCDIGGVSKQQTASCKAEEIKAYPTWEFPDGTRVEGVVSIEELTELSGFEPVEEDNLDK